MTDPTDNEREYRVLNQLISMHSRLADSYRRRFMVVATSSLLLSVLLAGFAFSGDLSGDWTLLGVTAKRSTWIGIGSCTVLGLSVTELQLDWRGKHLDRVAAVNKLSALKARYRTAWEHEGADFEKAASDASAEYESVVQNLPSIPEAKFNRLKAWHLRKIELSKAIEAHPGMPLLAVRALVTFRSFKK